MKIKYLFLTCVIIPFCLVLGQTTKPNSVQKKYFGTLPSGEKIYSYTLTNSHGMSAEIINYGATVVKLKVPDKNEKIGDVILGYDSLTGYINGSSYFGGTIGRYGNRLSKGRFTLDGKKYQVTINDGENSLHGGIKGFNKEVWKAKIVKEDPPTVEFTYVSPDGDQGYPGTLTAMVTFNLTEKNGLEINYRATTNKPTVVNLTSHCYFNLTANPENAILNQILMIKANYFTPIDSEFIPTGEIRSVKGTPMDFRKPTAIGSRISDNYQQLKNGKGYDHNFVLDNYNGKVREVATVYDPGSGRFMKVFTDQPGLQFYSGNFLDGTTKGKYGIYYKHRCALCLECQHFPDSPNHKSFPSTVLRPGQVYSQTTIYQFSVK
jgi:aldose 1-epimerase